MRRGQRWAHGARGALLGLVAGLVLAAVPSSASAQGADYSQCPLANPEVTSCFVAKVYGGEFKLGNTTVPIHRTITLQGGVITDPVTGETMFVDAANGKTLSETPLTVPGGLLGLVPPSWVPEPIRSVLQAAIDLGNKVEATAKLVGPVGFSFNNFANLDGPAITLPIRVHLTNPFLGKKCYIGSKAQPIMLQLTAGTTAPPAPARPISGDPGEITFEDFGQMIISRGFQLVDNAFSAPAASGCGGIFKAIINPIVNLREGLPSSAGNNVARQIGDFWLGDRAYAE